MCFSKAFQLDLSVIKKMEESWGERLHKFYIHEFIWREADAQ